MVLNSTILLLPSVDPTVESSEIEYGTGAPNDAMNYLDFLDTYGQATLIVSILFIVISLFGMAVNGPVIWILGFHMKRNSFTTYILNLSIADLALLTALVPDSICWILFSVRYMDYPSGIILFFQKFFFFTYSASQFLLAAISIDRCVCLFFPLWHKCHRPPHLSIAVCVAIWTLTFLCFAIDFALHLSNIYDRLWYYKLLLNAVLPMPAMALSTVAMLIKVCFLSPHLKQRKFLTAILLALLFFLLFAFPLNAILLSHLYGIYTSPYIFLYTPFGAILNSAINPVIYFLVGRDKSDQSRGRIKKTLEKLFQEEESCGGSRC